MQESTLQTIQEQAAKLSLQDHIKLMEALARQLREKSEMAKQALDWSAIYGLGKGLWGNQAAQEYVNSLRQERG